MELLGAYAALLSLPSTCVGCIQGVLSFCLSLALYKHLISLFLSLSLSVHTYTYIYMYIYIHIVLYLCVYMHMVALCKAPGILDLCSCLVLRDSCFHYDATVAWNSRGWILGSRKAG